MIVNDDGYLMKLWSKGAKKGDDVSNEIFKVIVKEKYDGTVKVGTINFPIKDIGREFKLRVEWL